MTTAPMRGPDQLAAKYQRLFEKYAFARIATIENMLKDLINKKPELKPSVEKHLAKLTELRVYVPHFAREATGFTQKIDEAKYDEGLHELDSDLAHRERVLGKWLVASILDNWRHARLERAKGRVKELEFAVTDYDWRRITLSAGVLADETEFLTEAPKLEFRLHWLFRKIYKDSAHEIWKSARGIRRRLGYYLIRFYPRFLIDVIRRKRDYVLITVGLFGIGIAALIEALHLTVWGLGGVLIVLGAVAPWFFEKVFKRRWLETHRKLLRTAAVNIYIWWLQFMVDRAYLDSVHSDL
jgi:hypothetical protein